jgi:hypothetical protein
MENYENLLTMSAHVIQKLFSLATLIYRARAGTRGKSQ